MLLSTPCDCGSNSKSGDAGGGDLALGGLYERVARLALDHHAAFEQGQGQGQEEAKEGAAAKATTGQQQQQQQEAAAAAAAEDKDEEAPAAAAAAAAMAAPFPTLADGPRSRWDG